MFGFRKKDPAPPADAPSRAGLFDRLRKGLAKTGRVLNTDIGELFRRKIDDSLFEELEERLLLADVGVDATQRIMDRITRAVKRGELKDGDALLQALEQAMTEILEPVQKPLRIEPPPGKPFSILVVGINGAGKTTTIGKLAHHLQADGFSVLLAAGDTFRAAAVEQLQTWGERNGVPVIAQGTGADSASVVFDALQAAQSRRIDVMIADTAGRLHTQHNLMDEIRKVRRVMGRLDPDAPNEVLMVVDGGTGQNAINQVRQFHEALGVTGLVVTKLDGTAKGGVLFALAEQMGIPVRFIGVGEKAEDLQLFDARAFVRALLNRGDD
ncbi:signal recognition particle-docking protein FtsY [Thioalkalivibrio paradoxus]|uniref:Signal recognition particle receptor FtsY n=1 Tax=Thioalkalivibrio paradoxus ARh 1 TaxID=713585 RepID=W0DM06_9GAMM|nr:signal recognition particle-docking protein FtsY [Thioalkalivibrio paradoxus]AHE99619.1 cell division protein FtsY [Thioalkalivibrio paradoxus ARh 1]